jgi:hypothetical protein
VVPVPVTVSWAMPSELMVIDMEDTPVRLDRAHRVLTQISL